MATTPTLTKVALVTASSAGLGAAIAKALAPHFRVVVNYFSRPEKAAQVIEDCEALVGAQTVSPLSTAAATHPSQFPRFHIIQADVTQPSEIQRLVEETVEKMGRLDVVVSNAGWTTFTNLSNLDEQLDEGVWDRCFNVNVKAHLWLVAAAKPHLQAKKKKNNDNGDNEDEEGGSFITVASLAGVKPSGSSLAYAVTKAAQIHLIKGLALICGPNKIRCNSISPGLLMTEWGQRFSQDKVDAVVDKALLKSLATVEDVADQVKTMALSKSMTGQNIVLDAGAGF